MPEHYECTGGGDAAAYALGALDDSELVAFRRHLQTCSVCQAEIQSFEQLTDLLPMTAPQYPATRALRRRVMTEVRADAPRQRAAHEFSEARPARGYNAGGARIGGLRVGQGLSQLVGPPRRAGIVSAGVALVLVLVVVIVGVSASGSNRRPSSSAATRVVSASTGSAQVLISGQHGELVVHHLPQLGAAQTYEVWKQPAAGSPDPTQALFNTTSTGDWTISVPGSLAGITKILVTKESAGGAAIPHGKPVIVAQIS